MLVDHPIRPTAAHGGTHHFPLHLPCLKHLARHGLTMGTSQCSQSGRSCGARRSEQCSPAHPDGPRESLPPGPWQGNNRKVLEKTQMSLAHLPASSPTIVSGQPRAVDARWLIFAIYGSFRMGCLAGLGNVYAIGSCLDHL